MILGKINHGNMRHCHFIKSTCDIGDHPHQGPPREYEERGSGWEGGREGVGSGGGSTSCTGGKFHIRQINPIFSIIHAGAPA